MSKSRVAFLAVSLALAIQVALAGPISPLYLTTYSAATGSGAIWVVQGNSVINSWTTNSTNEGPIAVNGDVRTAGGTAGSGGQYSLGGAFTGVLYPALGEAYDGATNGTHNYSIYESQEIGYKLGHMVQYDLNWSNPSPMFGLGMGIWSGIGYDGRNNTMWAASSTSGRIEDWALTGNLLSAFTATSGGVFALAVDPVDGTIWTTGADSAATLYQYGRDGAYLGSETYSAIEGYKPLGADFGPTPEPATLFTVGSAIVVALLRRRRR